MGIENRAQRIAGDDGRITQGDINRLTADDRYWDLNAARKILPANFFRQLEQGKWFWIGRDSDLSRWGYLDKLNQIESNYIAERASVQKEQQLDSNTLKVNLPRGLEFVKFWRTLWLQKPFMTGQDVQIFQQLLSSKGARYNCALSNGVFDGVFWPNTEKKLKLYQQEVLGQGGDGVMDMWGQTMISLTGNTWNPNPTQRPSLNPRVSTRNVPMTPRITPRSSTQLRSREQLSFRNPESARQYNDAIVWISSNIWNGTWSFVSPNVIMTAAHVVQNNNAAGRNLKIRSMTWKSYTVSSVSRIPGEDIAFIRVRESSPLSFNLNNGWSLNSLANSVMLWTHGWNPDIRFAEQDSRNAQVLRWAEIYRTSANTADFDGDGIKNSQDNTVALIQARKWNSGSILVDASGKPIWMITWAFHQWNGAAIVEPNILAAYNRFLQAS